MKINWSIVGMVAGFAGNAIVVIFSFAGQVAELSTEVAVVKRDVANLTISQYATTRELDKLTELLQSERVSFNDYYQERRATVSLSE